MTLIHKTITSIATLFLVAMLFSCQPNQKEELGEKQTNFPNRTLTNIKLKQKESGQLIVDLKAPIMEYYGLIDSPYTIFSSGLDLKYYDIKKKNDSLPPKKPGTLTADWVKMNEKTFLYEAKGNIKMINSGGDTITTQHIFWDTKKKDIYTTDTVLVKRANGDIIHAKNGLTAKEDLKAYTLYNHNGVFYLDEDSGL